MFVTVGASRLGRHVFWIKGDQLNLSVDGTCCRNAKKYVAKMLKCCCRNSEVLLQKSLNIVAQPI